jgi:hypothetical protein
MVIVSIILGTLLIFVAPAWLGFETHGVVEQMLCWQETSTSTMSRCLRWPDCVLNTVKSPMLTSNRRVRMAGPQAGGAAPAANAKDVLVLFGHNGVNV